MSSQHTFRLRVVDIAPQADDVVELSLARDDGRELPIWEPGAHVSLRLGPDMERQYSLCGPLDERSRWRVAVLKAKDGRGGSEHVHTKLKVGDCLDVRGPRNHFPFVPAPSYVFVAGGIGITPLLPMIEQACRQGVPWTLYYGGKTKTSMAYRSRLVALPGHVRLVAQDEEGILDLAAITAQVTGGARVYACGPEGLLRGLADISSGWPEGTLSVERFSAAGSDAAATDRPFIAHLRKSGLTIRVEADESILDAIIRAGVKRECACLAGTCGSCETRVLSGEIDHRDTVLTADEREAGEWMMVCVSRAAAEEIELDC